jgi:sugar phosphate isomerase/epimerase
VNWIVPQSRGGKTYPNRVENMLNKIKLGVSTFFIGKKDFDRFFDQIKGFPINYIEFKTDPPNFPPQEMKDSDIQNIKDKLEEAGLKPTVHAPIYDVNLASLNHRIREASIKCISESLHFARRIAAEIVVVHAGHLPRDYPERLFPLAQKNALDSLKQLAQEAGKFGILVGLENNAKSKNYVMIKGKDEHLSLIQEANSSNLKMVLDIGHANLFGASLEDYIKSVSPYLCEIHLHNNFGEKDNHSSLDNGEIDVKNLIELIKKSDLSIPLILEMDKMEDFKKSFDFLLQERFISKD